MTPEEELVETVLEEIKNRRPYASFFFSSDREVGEWGVTQTFLEFAQGEPGFPFGEPVNRGRGNDPPDCEVLDVDGRRIGIEVTELIDERAVAAAKQNGGVQWALWDVEKVRSAIQTRLTAKDGKVLKGGPYDEYLVLIFTDEPALPADLVERAVAVAPFDAVATIDRAYVLLSYDPHRRTYPSVRIPFGAV
jgi:hypothetical protein